MISQAEIQARYDTHRTTRNGQQREKLLGPEFTGLILDPILQRLEDPTIEPGYVDSRNCLVFWARPPAHIRALVDRIQKELLTLAPSKWLVPTSEFLPTSSNFANSQTPQSIIFQLPRKKYEKTLKDPSPTKPNFKNPN